MPRPSKKRKKGGDAPLKQKEFKPSGLTFELLFSQSLLEACTNLQNGEEIDLSAYFEENGEKSADRPLQVSASKTNEVLSYVFKDNSVNQMSQYMKETWKCEVTLPTKTTPDFKELTTSEVILLTKTTPDFKELTTTETENPTVTKSSKRRVSRLSSTSTPKRRRKSQRRESHEGKSQERKSQRRESHERKSQERKSQLRESQEGESQEQEEKQEEAQDDLILEEVDFQSQNSHNPESVNEPTEGEAEVDITDLDAELSALLIKLEPQDAAAAAALPNSEEDNIASVDATFEADYQEESFYGKVMHGKINKISTPDEDSKVQRIRKTAKNANSKKCPVCGRTFCREQLLKAHMIAIHDEGASRPDEHIDNRITKQWKRQLYLKNYAIGLRLGIISKKEGLPKNISPCIICKKVFKGNRNDTRARRHWEEKHKVSLGKYLKLLNMSDHVRNHEIEEIWKGMKTVKNILRFGIEKVQKDTGAKEMLQCPKCSQYFNSWDQLVGHVKRKYIQEPNYQELLLEVESFPKLQTELRRNKIESSAGTSNEKFTCEICGKVYTNRNSLYFHNASVHLRKIRYTCEVCNVGFYCKTTYKKHVTKHTDIRDCLCHICGKGFKNVVAVQSHISHVHDNKYPFYCAQCGHGLSKKKYLVTHKCGRIRRLQGQEVIKKDVEEKPLVPLEIKPLAQPDEIVIQPIEELAENVPVAVEEVTHVAVDHIEHVEAVEAVFTEAMLEQDLNADHPTYYIHVPQFEHMYSACEIAVATTE